MEGDAGASRLNPPPMPIDSSSAQATSEDSAGTDGRCRRDQQRGDGRGSAESEASRPDQPGVTAEDSAESEDETDDQPGGDGRGVGRIRGDGRRIGRGRRRGCRRATSRGRGPRARSVASGPRLAGRHRRGACPVAGGIGAGGYFALRFHHESQAIARNDAAALKAAMDCVSATQAPDTNAMAASEQKIIECGTDAFPLPGPAVHQHARSGLSGRERARSGVGCAGSGRAQQQRRFGRRARRTARQGLQR